MHAGPLATTGEAVLATACLAAAALGAGAYGMFAPGSRLFGPVICRGAETATRSVALTFDDGPWPGATDAILDILKGEGITAAFFVIGRYAQTHKELLQRMYDEGHVIANHSFDHARMGMFHWSEYWRSQIDRTDDAVERATGLRPALFRPPMGFKSPHLMRAARKLDCHVVTWTRRVFDGVSTTPERIVRHAGRFRPGEIVLLHDGREPASRRAVGATVKALPQLIDQVRGRGLGFERLDRLIQLPAYHSGCGPV